MQHDAGARDVDAATSARGRHALSLGFALVKCGRCAAQRVRGVVCPDCCVRPEWWEIDGTRQRRQRVVTAALDALDRVPAPRSLRPECAHDEILAPMRAWLDRFLAALPAAIAPAGDEEALHRAVEEFVGLRADAAAVPRLRPWLPLVDATSEAVAHLDDVARAFLRAVAAETPIEAQEAAAEAQRHLDQAGNVLADLGAAQARWNRATVSNAVDELIPGLTIEARRAAGAHTLLDLEAAGATDYHRLTGQECPNGFGVLVELLILQVNNIYDSTRFWETVGEAYWRLTARPGRLQALLESSAFRSDLRDALVRTYDSGQQAEVLLQASLHPRQHVGAVLGIAHALFESLGKRHTAALLSVTGRRFRRYDEIRDNDASGLHSQAQQAGIGSLLTGLDPVVRGAQAHLEWALDDNDGVVLHNRGVERRMSFGELIDHVLNGQETVLALTLAATCAAAARGTDDLIDADFLLECGVSDTAYTAMLARCLGLSNVVVEEARIAARVQWRILGRADPEVRPMNVAMALLVALPGHVDELALTAHSPERQATVEGPTDCWRSWRESPTDVGKQRAFIEACTLWRIDGLPLLTQEQVRKWMAVETLQAMQLGYPAAIAPLRGLRAIALKTQDHELAATVKHCISWVRQAAMNDSLSQDQRGAINRLSIWGEANVGSLSAMESLHSL